jgi:hypothetical protein
VLDPAVSPRRIWVLVHRLPPWVRSLGEPWSAEADLTALVIDHLAQLTYVTLRAAGAKNVSQPRPIPRPSRAGGRRAEPPPAVSAAPTATWVQQLAAIPGVVITDG